MKGDTKTKANTAILFPRARTRHGAEGTDLHAEERDAGEQIDDGLEVLHLLGVGGLEVVAVHGDVDAERVVKRVEQSDELLLAKVGGGEAVARRHVVGRRGVRVEGVDVGEQGAHLRRHAGTKVLG